MTISFLLRFTGTNLCSEKDLVSAGCKLLNLYNREMKALQNINDLILLKGGLKKSAFNRMQSTGVCHSYKSTIDLADKLADKWNEELLIWQDRSKHDSDLEHELIQQAEYLKDTIQLVSSAGATAIDLVYKWSQLPLKMNWTNTERECIPVIISLGTMWICSQRHDK